MHPPAAITKCAPAFDFYPERWTHGTRHMTKTERCDYLDLLCHQWTENGLPDDLDMIARLLGYKKPSQIPPLVLEKFPVSEDGRRRNQRLESERVKQIARIDKKRYGAAITNQKRWGERPQKESLSDRLATPERVANESPPPTTVHPPPLLPPTPPRGALPTLDLQLSDAVPPRRSKKTIVYTEDFEAFWRIYPRGEGKAEAFEQWRKIADLPPVHELLAIIEQHKKTQAWIEQNGKFIPHCQRWLSKRRWEDKVDLHIGTNGHQPKHPAYTKERATAGLTPEQIGTF